MKNSKEDFKEVTGLDAIYAAVNEVNSKDKKEEVSKKEDPIPEEEEEEAPAEITKDVKVDPKVEEEIQKTVSTEAHKIALRLISIGHLEDFEISVEEGEEPILISDFTQMTDEQLDEILKIQKQEKDNEIKEKYISKEGLKEHQLKVIEILKNGGDLSEIADSKEDAMKRPFEGFDMEDERRQVDVLYYDYTNKNGKGFSHERAVSFINTLAKEGNLASEANAVFEAYREKHKQIIDQKLEEQKNKKLSKEAAIKENKKAFAEKLKSAGLKDSLYKKVSSEFQKRDENGEYELVNTLRNMLENPQEYHEQILHLTDKKAFNEVFKIKAAEETTRKVVSLAGGLKSKGNRTVSTKAIKTSNMPWEEAAESYNITKGKTT